MKTLRKSNHRSMMKNDSHIAESMATWFNITQEQMPNLPKENGKGELQ